MGKGFFLKFDSIVTCPGYEYSDLTNKTTENRNWAAYSNPYFVAEFVDDTRVVLDDEKSAYSRRWEQIVEENAPLRILIDDVIVGVNEDYFDGIILSYVNNEPIPQKTVMGKMLGKWRGCDVAFISQRIEYLIAENIIKVCEDIVDDNDCYWSRTISLVLNNGAEILLRFTIYNIFSQTYVPQSKTCQTVSMLYMTGQHFGSIWLNY